MRGPEFRVRFCTHAALCGNPLDMTRFDLPKAPETQTDVVKAWSEPVTIPTYLPMAPDKNPMFLEKRVYQGSSGAVYPLPFYDRVATEPVPHSWQALHIENEFVS